MYCVYLTIYKGNLLPPFYIGSTSVDRIEKGYKGSVRSKAYAFLWLTETKKFPDNFKTIIISTHSTRKEAFEKEIFLQKKLQVHKNPLYINKAISNLHFNFSDCKHDTSTKSKISSKLKEKPPTILDQLARQKISDKLKGENNPFFGKKHTEETKRKISETLKGQRRSKRPDVSERNQRKKRKIAKYDKDMNLIKVYDNAKEAAREHNLKQYKNIYTIARNYQIHPNRTLAGYIWRYKE